MRMMATPAGPAPVARAKMVSLCEVVVVGLGADEEVVEIFLRGSFEDGGEVRGGKGVEEEESERKHCCLGYRWVCSKAGVRKSGGSGGACHGEARFDSRDMALVEGRCAAICVHHLKPGEQ